MTVSCLSRPHAACRRGGLRHLPGQSIGSLKLLTARNGKLFSMPTDLVRALRKQRPPAPASIARLLQNPQTSNQMADQHGYNGIVQETAKNDTSAAGDTFDQAVAQAAFADHMSQAGFDN